MGKQRTAGPPIRRISSLEQAGQLGQIYLDMDAGCPIANAFTAEDRKDPPVQPYRVALRGYYFTPGAKLEYGTLFFGERLRNPDRALTAIDNEPTVTRYKRARAIVAPDSDVTDWAPERKDLLFDLASTNPSRMLAIIQVVGDTATGKLRTLLSFPAALVESGELLYDVRASALTGDEAFDSLQGTDILRDVKTMEPETNNQIGVAHAVQAVMYGKRHIGNFHFPHASE